jgi:hypothetical protein
VLLLCCFCVVFVFVVVVAVRWHVVLSLSHDERQGIKDNSWGSWGPKRQSPVMCVAVCLTLWRLSHSVKLEALVTVSLSLNIQRLRPLVLLIRVMLRWTECGSTSGMILAGEDRSTVTKTFPSATLLRHQSDTHRAGIQPGPPSCH